MIEIDEEIKDTLDQEVELEEEKAEDIEEAGADDDFDPDVEKLIRDAKTKSKYQRLAYAMLSENQKLKDQVSYLGKSYREKDATAIRLQSERLQKDLDEAKARVALSTGEDPLSVADAQAALTQATINRQNFINSVEPILQEYEDDASLQQQDFASVPAQQYAMQHWLEVNEDINPNSSSCVPEIFQAMQVQGSALDTYLIEQGRGDLIGSPEYQEQLDLYANHFRQQYHSLASRERPKMAPAKGSVLPHRGSSSSGQSSVVKLSKSELEFIRENDLDINSYIKHKVRR